MILNKVINTFLCIALATAGAMAQEADTIPPPISENSQLNAVVLHYDANKARSRGDNGEAEQLLRKALQFDPEAAGIYYDLARINMQGKRSAEAEKNIKKAIELAPGNNWYKEQYANILLDQNRFADAAAVYEEVLRTDDRNKENLQKVAFLYQRAGDKKKALQAFDKLVSMYGDDEEILEDKVQLHLDNNELDKAIELSRKLIQMAPGESKYYILQAKIHSSNNMQDEAAKLFTQAEELFPDDPELQLALSEYYIQKGDKDKYKKYLEKLVTNNSLEPAQQLTVLGGFLSTVKDSTERDFALQMAGKLAKMHPDAASAQAAYGDMLGISGQLLPAAEQYKKALAIDPSNYTIWKNLLSIYLQEQVADSVVRYSDKALRLFPNQAQLHFLNGMGHNMKKDYTKAVNALQRAIDMIPEENKAELADMHGMLADVYNSTKQYDLSDENFDKALQLEPDNASTLNNYGYYLSERNTRLDDAEKMSKRSLELAPEQPTFLDTYGWIMYKKGNYKKAKEYIEKAIEKEQATASGTLWDHLGDINYKLNNKEKALECWQKAKELGADNPQLDKKIKELKLYE